jgi:hypothetical protein
VSFFLTRALLVFTALAACGSPAPPPAPRAPAPAEVASESLSDGDARGIESGAPQATGVELALPAKAMVLAVIAANADEALVRALVPGNAGLGPPPRDLLVVVGTDKGCLREIYEFPAIGEAEGRAADGADSSDAPPVERRAAGRVIGPERVLAIVHGVGFRDELARYRALLGRFGLRSDDRMAWSETGTKVLLSADDGMYRSDDGHTFALVDGNVSHQPLLTADGQTGLFRRCTMHCDGKYRLAALKLAAPSSPRFVSDGDVHDVFLAGGAAVFARAPIDTKLCIERFDVATGRVAALGCEATAAVLSESVLSVSADGRYGVLQLVTGGPAPAPPAAGKRGRANAGRAHRWLPKGALAVYDLESGRRVKTFEGEAIAPKVDGSARVAFATGPAAARKVRVTAAGEDATSTPIADGELGAWDARGRVVVFDPKAKAEPRACGIARAVPPQPQPAPPQEAP